MKFIQFDQNGALLTRFDSEIHGDGIPADAIEVSESLFYQTIYESDGLWILSRESGEVSKHPFPPPSVDQILAALLDAARGHMDLRAARSGFMDISDAVSYANEDSVPSLQTEAEAFRAWRSVVMERWRDVAATVRSGGAAPEVHAFIHSLPEMGVS